MDYNELKEVVKRKNLSFKDVSKAIEMSPEGLKLSIEKETISLKNLKKLCDAIGISPESFFSKKNFYGAWDIIGSQVHNSTISNSQHYNEAIDNQRQVDLLINQLKEKDEQIRLLLDLLKRNSNETNGAK